MFNSQYNRDKYMAYFERCKDKYLTAIVIYSAVILAEILLLIFLKGMDRKGVIISVAILVIILLSIHLIANIVRFYDVWGLGSEGYSFKQTEIVVDRIKDKEVNSIFCIIYIESIGVKLEIGKKYKISYLHKSLGKYIVDVEEIEEDKGNE